MRYNFIDIDNSKIIDKEKSTNKLCSSSRCKYASDANVYDYTKSTNGWKLQRESYENLNSFERSTNRLYVYTNGLNIKMANILTMGA